MNFKVMYGTLLGDGNIQFYENKNYYVFNLSQSEKEYLIWKCNMCAVKYRYYYYRRFDKRTEKYYNVHVARLIVDKKYKKLLYEKFYKPSKSTITDEVLEFLSPLSIAIWYMDDGNLYYNGNNCHLTLSTQNFDTKGKNRIIEYFKKKYNINFKETNNGAIRLTSVKDTKIFMKIVEKYIPQCMKRKTLKYQLKKYYKNKKK